MSVYFVFFFSPEKILLTSKIKNNKIKFRVFTSDWNYLVVQQHHTWSPSNWPRGWIQKLISQKVNLKYSISSFKQLCAVPWKWSTVLGVCFLKAKYFTLFFICVVYLNCFGKRLICQSSSCCTFNSLDIKTIEFEVRKKNSNLAS